MLERNPRNVHLVVIPDKKKQTYEKGKHLWRLSLKGIGTDSMEMFLWDLK